MDETALEPGRLSEVGVQNLTAVSQVIREQTVSYDFQYHKANFDCDLVSEASAGKVCVCVCRGAW